MNESAITFIDDSEANSGKPPSMFQMVQKTKKQGKLA